MLTHGGASRVLQSTHNSYMKMPGQWYEEEKQLTLKFSWDLELACSSC